MWEGVTSSDLNADSKRGTSSVAVLDNKSSQNSDRPEMIQPALIMLDTIEYYIGNFPIHQMNTFTLHVSFTSLALGLLLFVRSLPPSAAAQPD